MTTSFQREVTNPLEKSVLGASVGLSRGLDRWASSMAHGGSALAALPGRAVGSALNGLSGGFQSVSDYFNKDIDSPTATPTASALPSAQVSSSLPGQSPLIQTPSVQAPHPNTMTPDQAAADRASREAFHKIAAVHNAGLDPNKWESTGVSDTGAQKFTLRQASPTSSSPANNWSQAVTGRMVSTQQQLG